MFGTVIAALVALFIFFFLFMGIIIVPNQTAIIVERLGKYHSTLLAGFHLIIPFVDRRAYRRTLKENVLDVPAQTCITSDNVSVSIDGVIYMQVVKTDTMSNISYYLSASGLDSTEVMFDYIVDYIARHEQIAPPQEFHLTEEDWQEFRQRVIDSGFTYDNLSRKQFDELVKAAKFEGYYEETKELFDALKDKLHHDVATELDRHRADVQQLLELDIISSYYYQRGYLQAGLNYDKQLLEAERLLRNPEEYHRILAPK